MGFVEQASKNRSTRYLQISRWKFGANSSIILEFIALRLKARGDGPFVLWPAFNSSLVDSTYNCKTQQNATLTGQERQGYVQLKVSLRIRSVKGISALFCYIWLLDYFSSWGFRRLVLFVHVNINIFI